MSQNKCAELMSRGGTPVVLQAVTVSSDLNGLLFEASVEQRFFNPTDKNMEVIYTFPLPWGAVLLGVDVRLGDRHLSGAVVEKKLAEARYEEALSEGNAAIMLELNRDRSYSLNLGNLAAQESCVITLRYAQTLQFEQRGLRLMIPTVIAPRFGDAVIDGGLQPHQATAYSLTVDYPFNIELRLRGDLASARVVSPSHPIGVAHKVTNGASVLTVSLGCRASLDRDFVLVIDQLAHGSLAVLARDRVDIGSIVAMVSFCPKIPVQVVPFTAVKILVDCSGSMAGDSIKAAERSLQAIASQFQKGDKFSLSRFGSTVEHRSRGLWSLTETTRTAAFQWVDALSANLGGTEMASALESTFALAHAVASDVLLISDGEISAIDRTIELAKESGHRVFVVGIGSSPAETHLRRLAEATGGACDFVAPGEAVEPAVLRMFARLRSPPLTDLSLTWSAGVTPEWVSPLLPSVFDGDTVNVYALFRQVPSGDVKLLGKGLDDEAQQQIGCAAIPVALEAADTLSRMAALVRLHAAGLDEQVDAPSDPTQMAIDYQLVTDKTNFLLVYERPDKEKPTEMPALQKVDQMVPAGWGGTGSVMFSRSAPFLDTRILNYQAPPALNWSNVDGPSVPSVFRTAQQTSVPAKFRMAREPSVKYCAIDDTSVPAFLRKRDRSIDHNDPRYWTDSAHYLGLTPLGVSEWLRITPASEWPTTYMGLQQMGLGVWLIDWLKLVMAVHGEKPYAEYKVVEAFLYLMSRRETHESLAKFEGLLGALKSTASRLRGVFAGESVEKSASIDVQLVKAMVAVLEGMTSSEWPNRVLSLDGEVDEVRDARISTTVA